MLLNVFRVVTRDEELSKAVRSALLDALFASKASLIIGASCCTAAACVIAYISPSPWLIGCAILLGLAGTGRVVSFGMFRPGSGTTSRWDFIYHLGAWS